MMKTFRLFLAAMVLSWQINAPILAADFYWDADANAGGNNVNGTGLGGTGTWDTSGTNWWNLLSNLAWPNGVGNNDNAIFTSPFVAGPSTSNTVTVSSGINSNRLTFKRSGYSLTGGNITLSGTDPGIYVDAAETATIDTQISGTGGLIKRGAGSVRLTNIANNYTGTVSIQGGSIIISSEAALGGTGKVNITSGNNTPTNNALIGFTGGSLVLDGMASGFTFSRDIDFEGRGPNGDRSAAILSLGNNTLGGVLRSAISPLPPVIVPPDSLPSIRNSRINSVNGTLTITGTLNAGGTITVPGGTTGTTFATLGGVNQAGVGNFTFSGVNSRLTGTGSIEKSGGGTLFLNSMASNEGFGGTVRISASTAGEGSQSSVRVTAATVGANNVFGNNAGVDAEATIDMRGGVVEFRNDASMNIGKNVYQNNSSTYYTGPGVGGFGVNGTTTLGNFRLATNTTPTFNSRNGYSMTFGTWTQQSVNNNNTITNNLGGTLTFTGDAWNNNDGTARTLTVEGDGNTTINGSINSSVSAHTLTKTGSGVLTIVGTAGNSFGAVNVQGSLAITDFRSINNPLVSPGSITLGNATTTAGNLIIGTSGTPDATGLTTIRPIVLSTTTVSPSIYASQSGSSPVILNGAITRTAQTTGGLALGGTNTADNTVGVGIANQGTGGVTKVGSGTWVLAAPNGYTTATTISNGTLKLRANAASSTILPNANAITFANTGQFAGGALELVGQAGVNNVQTLGVLTSTDGANTVRLTPGAGGTASLVFASGTVGDGSSLNVAGSNATNTVTVGGLTAGALIDRVYFGGNDFAISTGGVLRAPIYGTDAGFVNAPAAAALPAGADTFSINGNITAQGSQTVDALKFNGGQTLTLSGGSTLVVRSGALNSDGSILATGGASTITGGSLQVTGSGSISFRVNDVTDSLTVGTPISNLTGGLTKSGQGTLILAATNTNTGTITINEGTIQLSGVGSTVGAASALTIRNGVLDLNGVTPTSGFNGFNNNGRVINSGASPVTLTVGLADGGGTSRGTIEGNINVTKTGTAAQAWYSDNTYTGITTIGGATGTANLRVDTLANGGLASGIGASTNAASNLVFTGVGGIRYDGVIRNDQLSVGSKSATTDRLFTLSGSATAVSIESIVGTNNGLVWSNTGAIVNNTSAAATFTLTGTSTGDNTFNPRLLDSTTGPATARLSLIKGSTSQWNLGNSNNTYTGNTTIQDGILALNVSGALPNSSSLVLGATTTSGILQTSGTFSRTIAPTAAVGAGTITWGGTTGGGGFAAHTGSLTVTLDGGGPLVWGSGGFVGTGGTQALILNSGTALSDVNFTNDIDLGAVARTVTANDNGNTGADFATLSGVLSGAGGGLFKNGAGILKVTGANTYTGLTEVRDGTLVVQSLGNSNSGTSSSVGASGVAMDNTNAVQLGAAGNNAAALQYVGAGETSDRKIRLNSTSGNTSTNQIHADGSGPLILQNVVNDLGVGAKTLVLRGTNTGNNMITSVLANDSASNALTIQVDGAATWILTGANTYGSNVVGSVAGTNANAGALGIGNDAALGVGPLNVNNGSVFAYGEDRTISNQLILSNNATNGWFGDHSLTFNYSGGVAPLNTNLLSAAANNVTTNNSIAAGKKLTIQGLIANDLTATRTWTIDGPGETVLNGNFATNAATPLFGVNISKVGDGILTLGTNGATSTWNKAGNNINVDRGTLRFTVNNAIPAAASSGGIEITPEVAAGDTATVDLNGTSQTVNSLSATTDGVTTIDNTSATAASLTFGANGAAVNFGTGTGTYSITDSGAGALSLTKTGTGAATIGGPTTTLSYSGSTNANGGTLNINSAINGSTAFNVIGTGTSVNLGAGFTSAASVTTVNVGGGASLGLISPTADRLTGLTSLTLGSTGGSNTTLSLNAGDVVTGDGLNTDTLSLASGGTLSLFAGNNITFNITALNLNPNQNYVLLDATNRVGGSTGFLTGPLSISNYLLGTTPSEYESFSLSNSTDNQIILRSGNLVTGHYYSGTTNTAWNGAANNWATTKPGNVAQAAIPGQIDNVVFAANTVAAGALVTTLEQDFKINSLTFEANSIAPANTPSSITINPGVLATNTLEVATTSATQGVKIAAGGSPAVTIAAPFRIGTDQTWGVADAASALTFSGAMVGTGSDVTKTGLGRVSLGAAADATFNTLQTSDFTVAEGSLEFTNPAALGSVATNNLARISVSPNGAFYHNNLTSGVVENNLTLAGGTLSAGSAAQTYSGTVAMSANSNVNLRNNNSSVLNAATNSFTLSGVVSGAGRLTINSANTLSAGNPLSGALILSGSNTGWSGGIVFNSGTVEARNVNALGTGDISASFGRLQLLANEGQTFDLLGSGIDLTVDNPSGAVFELAVDNQTATPVQNLVANLGKVTIGPSSALNALRIFQGDNFSVLNIKGGVEISNNASISVAGPSTNAATIDTIGISEIGGSRVLSINDDQGGWNQTNGILAINAASTYTGGTNLGGGTLRLGNKNAIGPGAVTITGASTLQSSIPLTGADAFANILTLNAALTVSGTNDITFSGLITGTGADAGRTLTSSLTGPATLTISSNVNVGASANTVARTLTIAGTGATTINGNLLQGNTFANAVTVTSTGLTIFAGANTYSGLTTMNGAGGILRLTGSNTTAAGTTLTAGTIQLASSVDNGLASGTLTLNGGTLQAFNADRTVSNVVVVSANSAVTGTQNLTFNNSFTNSGGNRTLTNNLTAPAKLTLAGNIFLSEATATGRTLTIAGPGSTDVTGVVQDFNGTGTPGNLTVTSTGVTTLSAANTYSGLTTMNGAGGTLRLTGRNSSAGGTTLTAGTIQIASTVNNGLASGTLTLNGGTLDPGDTARTINNAVVVNANSTVSGTQNVTFSSSVTNNGGNRTLTNSLTAPATLTLAGNVFLSEAAATGRTFTLAGAGSTDVTGIVQDFNGAGVAGNLSVTSTGITTLSAVNTYTGTTTMNGAGGTLRLTGSNTSGGGTTLTAGTVQLASAVNNGLATGTLTLNGGTLDPGTAARTISNVVVVANSSTVSGTQNVTFSSSVTNSGGNRTLTNSLTAPATLTLAGNVFLSEATATGRTFTIAGAGNTDVTGIVQDFDGTGVAGNLSVTSTGVTTLSAVNTYTGTTTMNGAGGTLRLTGSNTSAGGTTLTAGTVQLASAVNNGLATGTLTLNGGILDPGTSDRTISNAVVVSGANSTVNGTQNVTFTNSVTNSGGNRTLTNNLTAPSKLTLAGNIFLSEATASGRIFTIDGTGNTDITGVVQDFNGVGVAGGLSKAGAGTLTLSNTNLYTGATNVAGGTLVAGSTQAFGVNSATTVDGTLRLAGFSNTLGSLTGGSTGVVENASATAATLTTGGNNSSTLFSGLIQDGAGGGALSVIKTGTGSFSLTGANTYTGPTSVNAGTLFVNNTTGSGTGTGAVTVASGATLAGIGTITGNVNFLSGAIYNPGNSPGVQNLAGNVDFDSGSVFNWELTANLDSGPGTTYDRVDVSVGSLNIDAGAISNLVFNSAGSSVSWADPFWDTDRQWLVFDNTNAPTLAPSIFGSPNVGNDSLGQTLASTRGSFAWTTGGNDVLLSYTAVAVPEPGTLALLGLAGIATLVIRRRRANRRSANQSVVA